MSPDHLYKLTIHCLTLEIPAQLRKAKYFYVERFLWQVFLSPGTVVLEDLNGVLGNHRDLRCEHHGEFTGKN